MSSSTVLSLWHLFGLPKKHLWDYLKVKSSARKYSPSPITGKKPTSALHGRQNSSKCVATHSSIGHDVQDVNDDAEFWWGATSDSLEALLAGAGYTPMERQSVTHFYRNFIISSLGPPPSSDMTRWRSYMTDDFTPIEFSWNWGLLSDTVAPTVRFSIEAIGRDAGLPSDAWNWCETASFVERLAQEAPTVDLSLFYELGLRLLDECNQVDLGDYAQAERASRASTFLAFDLKGDVRIPKVYFVPFNHLATEERDQGAIIHDLLMPLAIREKWESLVVLLKFGLSSAVNGVVPFMIANDCVPLQKNRIKIYFRSADTTFRTVVDILGAFDAELWQGQALRELQELWRLLFKQDPGLDQRLPTTSHETAGILYYFEVRPGSLRIVPKVYLPVKHYGINDQHTAMALATFFRNHGPPRDQWIKEYLKTIGQICSHRRLEERSGLHTYISCSLKNGSLDITSYINPEIYSVYAEK